MKALFLSLLILLTGCSTTQMAYHYADWLLLNRIDHYFEINSIQRDRLKEQLKTHLTWHRQQELPLYIEFLTAFKTKAEQGLTLEEIDWTLAQFDLRRQQLFSHLLPDTADFLSTLTPKQIDYFEKKVIKKDLKVEKTPQEINARLEKRANKTLKAMKKWFGHLTSGQAYQIRKWSLALPDIKEDWTAYRQLRRKELITFLHQRPTASEIETLITPWLLTPKQAYPAHYQQKWDEMIQATKAMILKIDKLITPEQRQRALNRLEGYIEDFRALSR